MHKPDFWIPVEATEPQTSLLTFTTYGTWLHGDERGSVDRFHNQVGTPPLTRNTARLHWTSQQQLSESMLLGPAERRVIEQAVLETTRFRRWDVHAFNVRTNHVHAVVTAATPGPQVTTAIKANATRMLVDAGLVQRGRAVWTRGGSVRGLATPESIARACEYVVEKQGLRFGRAPSSEPA